MMQASNCRVSAIIRGDSVRQKRWNAEPIFNFMSEINEITPNIGAIGYNITIQKPSGSRNRRGDEVIMRKKAGSKIKRGKTLTSAGIILIALLILIVFAAASTGWFSSLFVMKNPLHAKDVQTVISVYGDDVVIYVSGGRDIIELREVIISINGVQLTDEQARQTLHSNTCIFSGAVKDISGTRDIAVKGVFSDGTITTLKCCSIDCS